MEFPKEVPEEIIRKIKLYVGNPMFNKNKIVQQAMTITMGLNRKRARKYPCYNSIGKWFEFWITEEKTSFYLL
tara:strand:+ start:346 stop:564 length:219 start_codon:yes stop_codon:yes gene_type:complete